jgi:transposase
VARNPIQGKEIRKLKAQVKPLEIEREILKKATVFFANETK